MERIKSLSPEQIAWPLVVALSHGLFREIVRGAKK